jgi:hypothetical protein
VMPRMPDTSPQSAARARRAYAENQPVRAALRRGDLSIAEVMREQPAGLADRTLFEILLMAHQSRPRAPALAERPCDRGQREPGRDARARRRDSAHLGGAQRAATRAPWPPRDLGAADGRLTRERRRSGDASMTSRHLALSPSPIAPCSTRWTTGARPACSNRPQGSEAISNRDDQMLLLCARGALGLGGSSVSWRVSVARSVMRR